MKISKDLLNNDVPAEGHLEKDEWAAFYPCANADLKIAFLGNSITRHGVAAHPGDKGMSEIASRIYKALATAKVKSNK